MNRETASSGLVTATRKVLGEIAEILEIFPRAVVVGGSVPYLLIPQDLESHEGTVDIDIVFDIKQPGADPVLTLHEMLERRLFVQDPRKPFRYEKGIHIGDQAYQVIVELLAGGPTSPSGMVHIPTEDIYVSIIPGMEVALVNPRETRIPASTHQTIHVASIPSFFAMKARALQKREALKKTKDAYDIVYCLRNYPGGSQALAEEFRMAISHPMIASGVELLESLFSSVDAMGPQAYAWGADDFVDVSLKQREAYERVAELLAAIDRLRTTGP